MWLPGVADRALTQIPEQCSEICRGNTRANKQERAKTTNCCEYPAYARGNYRITDRAGKIRFFFSESSEFIFGDGFYHNISIDGVCCEPDIRILVPLTPNLTVLYVRPMAYMVEPKLMTRLASHELVMRVNETVQIYSKEYLFYRSEKPTLSKHFFTREHLIFSGADPIDQLIDSIPGVGDANLQLRRAIG